MLIWGCENLFFSLEVDAGWWILTQVSFGFFVDLSNDLERPPEISLRQVVRAEAFQKLPVGGVVVNRWEFDQRLPQLLG